MNRKEIAVGNWVHFITNGIPCRITEIYLTLDTDEPKRMVSLSSRNGERYCVYIEDIEPIEISPEILERIGFKRSKTFVEWKYEADGVYILWKPFSWIKIQTKEVSIIFPCEYVHELQNALTIAKIDKEFVL